MKTPGLALVNCVLALGLSLPPALPAQTRPVPDRAKAEQIMVGSKKQTYYRLTSQTPLRLKVDGPKTLTVFTRLILSGSGEKPERYSVVVRAGGKELARLKTQAGRASGVLLGGKTALAKLRKLKTRLPAGTHALEISLEGPSAAMVKFSLSKAGKAVQRVAVSAHVYDRVVTAVVKEKLLTYYTSTGAKKVQLRVIGPTRIKVATRLNYDPSMKGRQSYSIGVTEGGSRIAMKALSTSKALGVEYREWKEVAPGKAVSFFLNVPSGEHHYTFSLENSLAKSVSLRFGVPQRHLKNEK